MPDSSQGHPYKHRLQSTEHQGTANSVADLKQREENKL